MITYETTADVDLVKKPPVTLHKHYIN